MKRKQISKKKIIVRSIILVLISILLFFGWYFNRPQPDPIQQQNLFNGITYTRLVQTEPVKQIFHVAEINLQAGGLTFLVTPSDDIEDYDYSAQTTSQFLDKYNLQFAINGDFFTPYHNYGPHDYYPRVGDVTNVGGLTASRGELITEGYNIWSPTYTTLYISKDNQASFDKPIGEIYNAISGHWRILENGFMIPPRRDYHTSRQPRTAIGLSPDGNTLILVVVDGRQPNYSEGATIDELADVLLQFGAYNALNLDGGGSSVMVYDDNDETHILNSPIHTRIPGQERPVANHLGIYAKP